MRRIRTAHLPRRKVWLRSTGLCEQLGEAGFLHQSGGDWHWIDEAYPADTISLRSVTSDNFVIIDTTGEDKGKPEVIGEVDFSSALTTVHPKAIYIHQGQQYHVEHLDFDKRKAYVKPVNVDYFTDAIRYTQSRRRRDYWWSSSSRAWRRPGAIPSCWFQEDQVLHQRECGLRQTRIAGE